MRARVLLLTAVAAVLATAAPAHAAVYTVTGTVDPGTCSGFSCTGLQAALNAAKATKGADEVDLKKATYTASKGLTMSDSEGVTVVGLGARGTVLNGNTGVRTVSNSGAATLEHLKVTGGSIVDNNGGGIFNSGALTLDHVEVSGNSANNGGNGGGIASTGSLTILYSLIASNTTTGDGGGIFVSGVAGATAATLSVRDSTVAFNTSQIRSGAGGIDMRGNPNNAATLQRVTVADNTGGSPDTGAGGILVAGDGEVLAARATIVSGNKDVTGAASNCLGQPRDDGFNLESGSDCAFKAATDKQNADPGFPTGLVDGGGETDVLPIPSTSPAVDLAPACTGVTDQRDLARPQGKGCDAGAYEFDQAPDMVIDSGPPALTNNGAVQFTFHSSEPGVTFQCSTGGAFAACSSPASFQLGDGTYTFTVQALDGTHAAVPASATFTVDATAPAAPVFTAPANNAALNTHSVTLQGTAEAGARVRIQEGQLVDATVIASGTGAWSAPLTVAEGTHNYTAFATDAAGNTSGASATRTITVDTAAPAAPTITTPSADALQASATINLGGGAEPGATVKVLEGATVRATVTAGGQGQWLASFTATDGAHPYAVTATDAAGNTSPASGTRTVTVDTTAPAAPAITAPPNNSLQNSATVTVGGTAEAGATVEVFEGTASRGTATATGGTWTKMLTGVADGPHTYTGKATDIAGNTSTASATRTVTVDTTPPAKPAITGAQRSGSTVTLTGTADSGTTVTVRDGTTVAGTPDNVAGQWTLRLDGVPDGRHVYTATAKDPAGNVSAASNAQTVDVDTGPPAPPTIDARPDLQRSATVSLSGTAEPGSTVEVFEGAASRGTAAATDGTWSLDLAGVADGAHTYTARATDVAGNTSVLSAPRAVTVDTSPPPADVTGGPAGVTSDPAPAFSFDSSDPSTTFVCRLDGPSGPGTAAPCTSPHSFGTLAPGSYTFVLTAVDAAGNPTTTSRSFTVASPQQGTPTPTPTPTPVPVPVPNKSVVVQPAGGTVLVREKGTHTFVTLDVTKGIPLGSEVDARHGKVELTSVPKPGAKPQTALFYGGIFVVTQSGGITQLALSEPLAACPRGRASAAAAKKKKPKSRNLWGDGHGSFRTKGQYSAATVRGTKWNVQDSCAGTLTRVSRGVVAVNDFVKHKTKVLRARQRYLAKPRRR